MNKIKNTGLALKNIENLQVTLKPVNIKANPLTIKAKKENTGLAGLAVKPLLNTYNVNSLPAMQKNYTLKYFPAAIKVFLNSVYSFNKSFVKNLVQADNIVYKIIKGYFTLNLISDNKQGKKSRLLVRRYKKLSLNRIIVSKPEIKHSADHVMITVYVYNKKKHSIIYRLKQLYKNIIWGKLQEKSKSSNKINKFIYLQDSAKKTQPDIKRLQEINRKNKILNLLHNSFNKKVLQPWQVKQLKEKLQASLKNKEKQNIDTSARGKALKNNTLSISKQKAKTLNIITSIHYNLKMKYLLHQDREYTASTRSFNFAKKKVYIGMGRKFNFYNKEASDILNLNIIYHYFYYKMKIVNYKIKSHNKKHIAQALKSNSEIYKDLSIRVYVKNSISTILNIKKLYNYKNINNIMWKNKEEMKHILMDLLKIKPRVKLLKRRFKLKLYRTWTYKNKKQKRSKLFKRSRANIIHIRGRALGEKLYKKELHLKSVNEVMDIQDLLLQAKKNKENLQTSAKVKANLKKPNLEIKSLKNPVKLLEKSQSVVLKPELKKGYHINKTYKDIDLLKKTNVRLNPKENIIKTYNKKRLHVKSNYKPYQKLNTNIFNSILLLKKLKKIDKSFNVKTKIFNKEIGNILQQDNKNYRYLNNNITMVDNYVKLKYLLKLKWLNELLHREILYIHYIRSLYINNLVFKTGFINSLCNIISKVYNKKVKLNIVSLKYLFFNSDIFSQAITTRLKNHRRNRLFKVLNKVLGLVYLAKINEYAYNIHNPIYKYIDNFNNKYKHLRSHLQFTQNSNVKPGNANLNKVNIKEKLAGFPLYNLNHILFNEINFIKCKSVFGIKLQAKGRLTKRSTASRKIFKVRYLGNLRYNAILNRNRSSYIIKNNMISNIQFTKIAGKTRIGSFGIKGWINNN